MIIFEEFYIFVFIVKHIEKQTSHNNYYFLLFIVIFYLWDDGVLFYMIGFSKNINLTYCFVFLFWFIWNIDKQRFLLFNLQLVLIFFME